MANCLDLQDIAGIGPVYSSRLRQVGKLNDAVDLLVVMIDSGDEEAFRDWLRNTCQMKRRDHFENCYEHLQSLLKDPVIRKMVQDRKGRRVFPQSTTPAKETQRLVLQNRGIYHDPNSYFDLQEIFGIEPMCACRLRSSAQVKDSIDLLVKFATLVVAIQQHYGDGQQSRNEDRKIFELWLRDTCGMSLQDCEICYNHIQRLMNDANTGSIQTPAANTSVLNTSITNTSTSRSTQTPATTDNNTAIQTSVASRTKSAYIGILFLIVILVVGLMVWNSAGSFMKLPLRYRVSAQPSANEVMKCSF